MRSRRCWMRSDFEPKAIKKAKQVLQKHLNAAEQYQHTNEVYRKEVFKPSLLERVKRLLLGSK